LPPQLFKLRDEIIVTQNIENRENVFVFYLCSFRQPKHEKKPWAKRDFLLHHLHEIKTEYVRVTFTELINVCVSSLRAADHKKH
jgi:hypothetical protein